MIVIVFVVDCNFYIYVFISISIYTSNRCELIERYQFNSISISYDSIAYMYIHIRVIAFLSTVLAI